MRIINILGLVIVIAINMITPILISKNVERFFRETDLVEETLAKIKKQQNFQNLIIIISIFLFAFFFSNFFSKNEFTRFIMMLSPFIFIIIILVYSSIIYHPIYVKVRGIETTIKEEVKDTFRAAIVLLLPSFVIVLVKVEFINKVLINQFVNIFISVFIIIGINLIYPYVFYFSLRAEAIKFPNLNDIVLEFLEQHNIKKVKVYQWPAVKGKMANALVGGLIIKKIFISDYLIENMEVDELKAILAHEIGHIKKYHLWIKVTLLILAYPIFTFIGYMMDSVELYFSIKIPIPIGITFFVGCLSIYFSIIYMFFSRYQEYKADEYALKSGIEAEILISAFTKLAKLNNSLLKVDEKEERIQTHPSFNNRIERLRKLSLK
ncbi:M48 family metalloprotease [Clostridium cellulovorans]|uniref:Peptidase M48 Ste24p n=1 Tax=Clostridium cellulovorans (strain ATCC 35296 / DSM 3052 / OCM 3 / 743B) TaxID=573061 RepID=D9SPP4_CLOC7|nr:M48 family metalloprotease [Clostridium cellulovorans]ADL50093.1 peptidase M48 Ste24p [Clostridium cellulovorans 743B]